MVRIAVDGRDVGQCFTTWENYYRTAPEQAPPPNRNTPADINSLQFRSSVPGPPALATSGGYLFDNVSITPSNGPGPPGCSGGGEVPPPDLTSTRRHKRSSRCRATSSRTGSPSETAATRRCARLRACDRVPRALRFVRATARLQSRRGPSAVPHDPSAAARSAQDVPRHLPAARERHGGSPITNGASADVPIGSAPSPSPPDAAPSTARRRRRPEQRRRRVARDADDDQGPPTREPARRR